MWKSTKEVIHNVKKLNKKNFMSRQTFYHGSILKIPHEAYSAWSHIENPLNYSGFNGLCRI
jgi:hypothetical protein